MKNLIKTGAIAIVLMLFVLVLGGCSSGGYNPKIIGKWVVTDLEFKSDNQDMVTQVQQMLMSTLFQPNSTIEFINKIKVSILMNSMNYKWIKKDKLQLGDEDGGDAPLLFDVVINNDKMTFDNQVAVIHLKK